MELNARCDGCAAVIALLLMLAWPAWADPQAATALDEREYSLVIAEVQRMVATDESVVPDFVVEHATPARIERLFAMPERLQLSASLRSNALIFAGRGGALLRFAKPSDVHARMQDWFPQEMAAARAEAVNPEGKGARLWGPFRNWDAEAAAFVVLWKCMPQQVWLQPDAIPFAGGSRQWRAIDNRGSFDVAQCVRLNVGEATASSPVFPLRVRAVLVDRLTRHIEDHRCRLGGPDDCALVLHLLSAIAPGSDALAVALHHVAADFDAQQPLPAYRREWSDWQSSQVEDGAERFAEAQRRAAYLRARLLSLLHNPKAWPDNELADTLRNSSELQLEFAAPFVRRWPQFEIEQRTLGIPPWPLTTIDGEQPLPPVLASELDRLDETQECVAYRSWLDANGPVAAAAHGLLSLRRDPPRLPRCQALDWTWLRSSDEPQAATFRAAYVQLAGELTLPALRDLIVGNLLQDGADCFRREDGDAKSNDWRQPLCARWVHEPTDVGPGLSNTGLTLDPAAQFTRLHLASIPQNPGDDQRPLLLGLVAGLQPQARNQFEHYVQSLHDARVQVREVKLWRHPAHSRAFVALQLGDGDLTLRYLLLTPQATQTIDVPSRFASGASGRGVARVSDLDADGQLELWWGPADLDRCVGDGSDLARDLDCSAVAPSLRMGEIQHGRLTWFTADRDQTAPTGEQWRVDGDRKYPLPAQVASEWRTWQQRCNVVLVAERLSGDGIHVDDIVDLACAAHPAHAGQTIVALFRRTAAADASGDESFERRVVVFAGDQPQRQHRQAIEQDASIRIGGETLTLDTTDYPLAPGVSGFGVQMNIGYSPKMAEGGESAYFSLIADDGSQLREVVSALSLSNWHYTDDSRGCWGSDTEDDECIVEEIQRRLLPAATATDGWRDLQVLTTTTRRRVDGEPAAQAAAESASALLRYGDGSYR